MKFQPKKSERFPTVKVCGSDFCLRRVRIVLVAMTVLFAAGSALAQGRSAQANSALAINIRPAALMQMSAETVNLKIRLAHGAQAYVWTASECSSPAQVVVVEHSGIYDIANTRFEVRPGDKALCLASSDGLIALSVPLLAESAGSGQ